ncbi:MAG TPA: GDSL-type esterase/lipase family protein [Ohtaekwangia sp.]|nr:GDSL-type esterase/lipase family protein [Ohtaekwangia sp.]
MKKIGYLFSLVFILTLCSFMIQQKRKIIFFGDSITQAGVQPGGYIMKIGDLAAQENLQGNYEFIGAGIGGNKVYDLYLRLEEDVLNKKPDVVFIYVGVNDVWHKQSHGTGTDADKFEKFYTALITNIQGNGADVILVTPGVIGERTDFSNQLDGDLNHYSNIIRGMARQHKLKLVDLRTSFLEYNRRNNPANKESGILTTDRVHLNDKGNQLVADEMWKVIKALK